MKRKKDRRHRLTWTDRTTGGAIRLRITHTADYLASGTDHLEIESVPKDEPHPLSETGYRSQFIGKAELNDAGGAVAYVRQWLGEVATKANRERKAQRQEDLFAWAERVPVVPASPRNRTRSPPRPRARLR